jgi:hypothetical protein
MKFRTFQYRTIAAVSVITLVLILACGKNFLDKKPLGAFSPDQLYNAAGVQGLLVGAYHMVSGEGGVQAGNNYASGASNWAFGSVAGGDSYKGSTPSDQGDVVFIETWAYNANNPYFNLKWQALYDGAQRANDVIRTMAKVTDLDDASKKVMLAEAYFLRAHFHFEAKKMWNNVPFVDETITYVANNTNVPNIDGSGNYIDIWPKIEADMQKAVNDLPDKQPQVGRANKSAAIAYLGKIYLYEHKYALAKAQFDKIIPAPYGSGNGQTNYGVPYHLVNFQDNFNAATDNSAESIFAYQSVVNDGSGTNGNYGDVLNFPNSAGPGGCCGFNNPSISLANSYKTGADGLPMLDTYNSTPNVSDPAAPYTGNLDPRIDITMGRPGIPFFDWGPTPTNKWVRDPGSNGYFSPKKNVYAKSQQGVLSSTETSFWGPTQLDANNVNIIRFADVLLWAAECEIEVGSAAKALEYVNYVRMRAADPTGWVYSGSDYDASAGKYKVQVAPADKYLIKPYPAGAFADKTYALKAIRFERKLELAMEGHRFFDLARWDNGTGTVMAPELNAFAAAEKQRPTIFAINNTATFTPKKNEYYPIPQQQIDIENAFGTVNLKQNPGY